MSRSKYNKYDACVRSATKRHRQNKLQLCPRGYCTAKQKYRIYPSAYANAYASKVCKGTQPDLKGMRTASKRSRGTATDKQARQSNLQRWFAEKWVDVCKHISGNQFEACGRAVAKTRPKTYPYCRPTHRVDKRTPMTVDEIRKKGGDAALRRLCQQKPAMQPGVDRKPTYLRTRATARRRAGTTSQRDHCKHKQTDAAPHMTRVQQYNIASPCKVRKGKKTYYMLFS